MELLQNFSCAAVKSSRHAFNRLQFPNLAVRGIKLSHLHVPKRNLHHCQLQRHCILKKMPSLHICSRNDVPISGFRNTLSSRKRLLQKYYCSDQGQDHANLQAWELFVNYEKLSPLELKIHRRHSSAVKNSQLFYTDPVSGYQVMTRLAHIQRGECCGNECRHCPYGRANVPAHKRTKTHNSAFYT